MLSEVSHADCEAELRPGDALLLFTDGLVEAGAPENVMGPEALVELAALVRRASGDRDRAARSRSTRSAQRRGEPRDDIALLVTMVPPR